jgi:hypothetical protein
VVVADLLSFCLWGSAFYLNTGRTVILIPDLFHIIILSVSSVSNGAIYFEEFLLFGRYFHWD